jgi:lysozyme
MIPSQKCIDLIKKFEGYQSNAYKCPASIITIGYGSTMYMDGTKIKMGDVITEKESNDLLFWEVANKSKAIGVINVNQNKFDALVSFAYNLGIGALRDSTLFKKVRMNSDDATIRDEFMKWTKARVNGKLTELPGLVKRRKAEVDLYFSK